ncbi:uncharacterized protein LOC120338749 [Styela clava]
MVTKSLPALGLEREYGEKIDKCITDTLLKAGAGFLIGGVFSFALFKRRAWPVTLGTGIGLGIAYRNCEDNLRSHYIKKDEVEKATSLVEKAPTVEKIPTEKLDDETNELMKAGLEEVKNLSETLIGDSSNEEPIQAFENETQKSE